MRDTGVEIESHDNLKAIYYIEGYKIATLFNQTDAITWEIEAEDLTEERKYEIITDLYDNIDEFKLEFNL